MSVLKALKLKDFVTLMGTFTGFVGIVFCIAEQAYRGAILFIFLGIGFDFLDGYVANRTNSKNALGVQLDSLSDSFVFGIAPAIIAFIIYTEGHGPVYSERLMEYTGLYEPFVLLFPSFIFACGAILRLAWFNIREEEDYQGLPTPLTAVGLLVPILIDYFTWSYFREITWLNLTIFYALPFWMVILAFFNITNKINYGEEVRKKDTNYFKYIFIVMICSLFSLLIFLILDRFYIISLLISLFIFTLFTIWILYGFGVFDKKDKKTE